MCLLCVNANEKSSFADVKRPLIGQVQEKQTVVPLPSGAPSQAIVDVSENLRAKIYAVFCKLGTQVLCFPPAKSSDTVSF